MKDSIVKGLEQAGLKKSLVKVYLFFTGRFNAVTKKTRLIFIPFFIKQRSKNGYYAIEYNSDWLGLGSRIIQTIEILLYCETNGLQPLIRYSYKESSNTSDYFKEIFFYKNPLSNAAEKKIKFTKIRDNNELQWKENYNQKLKLNFARSLFDKYLGIQPVILDEVEIFCQKYFFNKKVLGIHYRGTDKAGEAPLVPKEKLLKYIAESLIEKNGLEIIFLSTDDQEIINFLKNSNLELPLIFREDSVRSTDGEQFHRKKEISKSLINRDAMVNCLLLSHCDVLIKTASFLSDCSVVFNTSVKVKAISFPHSDNLTWWPATEIKQNQILSKDLISVK